MNGLSNIQLQIPHIKSHALSSNGPAGGIRGHPRRLTKQLTRTKNRDCFLINRVEQITS